MKVLFVCTGNTCRSPMAEALLKNKLKNGEEKVRSAGIYASTDGEINENAKRVLGENQIVFNHTSQPVTTELLEWADLVLTMTKGHKSLLLLEYPMYQQKIDALIRYVQNESRSDHSSIQEDIQDPFGQNVDIYRKTLSELDTYITKLLDKLNVRG